MIRRVRIDRQDKQGRRRCHVRDSHREKDLLFNGRLHSDDGRLDKSSAERAKAERDQAFAKQRGQ